MPSWSDYAGGLAQHMILRNQQDISAQHVDQQKAITTAITLDAAMKARAMQAQQQYQQALLASMRGDPTRNNEQTSSISDSQDPMASLLGSLRQEQKQLQDEIKMSALYPGVDVTHKQTRLSQVETNLRETIKDSAAQQKAKAEGIANMLRDADTPEKLKAVERQIATDFGPAAAERFDRAMPHDLQGNLVYNDAAKAAIAPVVSKATSMATAASMAQHKATLEQQQAALEETKRRDDTKERYENARVAQIQAGLAEDKGQGKPPAGYRWSTATAGALEPIPGGPADPATIAEKKNAIQITGGRESVYTNRIMQAASQASKDLANIVKIPLASQTTGLFGGRGQQPGLLNATKEVMAQEMTSQDAQTYQVMATGLQRTLAAVETSGLAQGIQEFSKQIDVVAKAGETNLTKAHKLAQIRQIIEAGMENILVNPRVTEDQKDLVRKTLDKVYASVPFTHSDLIELTARQAINPKTTLQEILPKVQQKATAEPTAGDKAMGMQTAPLTPQQIGVAAKDAWGAYEPDKYDYRIGPNNVLQRKRKESG